MDKRKYTKARKNQLIKYFKLKNEREKINKQINNLKIEMRSWDLCLIE